jgi:hypothetical protein
LQSRNVAERTTAGFQTFALKTDILLTASLSRQQEMNERPVLGSGRAILNVRVWVCPAQRLVEQASAFTSGAAADMDISNVRFPL